MKYFPLQIARRYLFGKKSTTAINYITGISVLGIAIGTTALILILSVFNGFESLTKSYLDSFNPDLKITLKEGKFFKVTEEDLLVFEQLEGVVSVSRVIEEVAHFEYNSKQRVGVIKGVDDAYLAVNDLDQTITKGEADLNKGENGYMAVVGNGIYHTLNINLNSIINALKISVPNRRKRGAMDRDFKTRSVGVSGVFSIRNERDNQYILSDYGLVSGMLDLKGECTALEVRMDSTYRSRDVIASIATLYPRDKFDVKDRLQQESSLLKIMNIEKWSSYLIFSFTLLLIIFNVIGCLWMIVLDKKKDISVLQSFGATKATVRNIFLVEGALISGLGFGIGLACSVLFYVLQKNIGIITVPDGFSISNYPMEMEIMDVGIIFFTVMLLGIGASIPAAMRAKKISAYVRME